SLATISRALRPAAIEVEAGDAMPLFSLELAIIAARPRDERWFSEFWLAPGGRVAWIPPPVD
ncbi:MAG: hypothetical protein OER93_05720, partial [Thermoleophilia bacterium]|nr:hypothetical protein [Thermoleophilia bacterium]